MKSSNCLKCNEISFSLFSITLQFVTSDGGLTTLVYQVTSISQSTSLIISQFIQITAGSMYNVTLQISTSGATVTFNSQSQSSSWVQGHTSSLFASSPSTQIVLGNMPGQAGGSRYTGCIHNLHIDGVPVPLTGLLASSGYNKVASTGVTTPCSACGGIFPALCDLARSSCVEDPNGPTMCKCLQGFVAANNSCVPTLVQGGLQTQADQKVPLMAIIGAVAGTLTLLMLVMVTIIVVLRCKMQKTVKQHTYSVTPEPNYDPKFSPKRSSLSLKSQHSQQGDGSDASSQPAPIETSDRQSDTNNSVADGGGCPPPHPTELAWTKSVTSAETGFNTNSERDNHSVPHTEEPPKEASYSQLETGSEDTSCMMEEILSPAGMNLIGSMSQNLGITYQPVLTEAEKKILTPLRPGPEEPLSLTVSEYAADIADRPAFNYRLRPPFSTLQSMPEGHEVPSSRATPPWYTSNASDSETEDTRRKTAGSRRNTMEDTRSRKGSGSIPKVTSMPPSVMAHEVTAAAATPPPARESAPSRHQRHRLHSADSPLVHSHSYKYGRQNSCRSAGGRRGLSPLELSSEGSEGYSYTAPRHPRYGSPPYFDAARPDVDYSAHVTPPRSAGPYGQQEFKDLKSVSNINPILYWEIQSRMKTTVDQDSYPLSHMEDASTQTNSDVFTDPLNVDFSNDHNATDMMLSSMADLTPNCHTDTASKVIAPPVALGNDDDDDDYDDKPEMGPTHFPSADCSEEYGRKSSGGTLLGTQSDESTRLSLSSDYDPVPPQMSFDT